MGRKLNQILKRKVVEKFVHKGEQIGKPEHYVVVTKMKDIMQL